MADYLEYAILIFAPLLIKDYKRTRSTPSKSAKIFRCPKIQQKYQKIFFIFHFFCVDLLGHVCYNDFTDKFVRFASSSKCRTENERID